MASLRERVGLVVLCLFPCTFTVPAAATESSPPLPDLGDRTPLAGEGFHTELFGRPIDVPARDRRDVTALDLGALVLQPAIASVHAVPFFALYLRRHGCRAEGEPGGNRRHFRGVFSGVVNDVRYADSSWNRRGIELLARFDNHTIPIPTSEIDDGEKVGFSELLWGTAHGSLGIGWRLPVAPGQFDNSLRLELTYGLGAFYCRRTSKTADQWQLPSDTLTENLSVGVHYDGLQRNLMELLHRGIGFGAVLSLERRLRWHDNGIDPTIWFRGRPTRDTLKFTAHAVAAVGVPFLSERHRLVFQASGGLAPSGNLDRFSAFRGGSGPPPSEANDLGRHPFPGALFEQVVVERFLIVSLEYRFELFFFLYLHLRGTLAWGTMFDLSGAGFLRRRYADAQAVSVAVTSGFFWDSMLYAEYTFDHGPIHRSATGHAILLSWSKSF